MAVQRQRLIIKLQGLMQLMLASFQRYQRVMNPVEAKTMDAAGDAEMVGHGLAASLVPEKPETREPTKQETEEIEVTPHGEMVSGDGITADADPSHAALPEPDNPEKTEVALPEESKTQEAAFGDDNTSGAGPHALPVPERPEKPVINEAEKAETETEQATSATQMAVQIAFSDGLAGTAADSDLGLAAAKPENQDPGATVEKTTEASSAGSAAALGQFASLLSVHPDGEDMVSTDAAAAAAPRALLVPEKPEGRAPAAPAARGRRSSISSLSSRLLFIASMVAQRGAAK